MAARFVVKSKRAPPHAAILDGQPDADRAEWRHESRRNGDARQRGRIAHSRDRVCADGTTRKRDSEVERVRARAGLDFIRKGFEDVEGRQHGRVGEHERDGYRGDDPFPKGADGGEPLACTAAEAGFADSHEGTEEGSDQHRTDNHRGGVGDEAEGGDNRGEPDEKPEAEVRPACPEDIRAEPTRGKRGVRRH